MNLIQKFMTYNPCYINNVYKTDSRYTTFQQRGPRGLMLHSVGCAQPNAMVFINNWNKSTANVCVHGFVDANTGEVYQTLPWNFRGWHSGGSSNNTHIGVEMCESKYIHYPGVSAYFEIINKQKAQEDCKRAYNSAVKLFAYLCEQYHLNPLTDICSHKEGHAAGVASNHGDPEHYWSQLGMPYTMNTFRQDVDAEMKGEINMTKDELNAIIDARIGKQITNINNVPWDNVKDEVKKLLVSQVIDGGTPYEKDPDDINLPLELVRVLVVCVRYIDLSISKLKEELAMSSREGNPEA